MLVFDGDCAFCNRAVQFVLAHELVHGLGHGLVHQQRSDLLFVPRDSELGRSLRRQYSLERVESLLWVEDGQAFIEFDSVAHTAAYVGGIYARLAAAAARCLPRPLLNGAYRLFARIRKRVALRPRHCLLLTAAQQQRFLQ
jgi:predicted DCC family thiol-disulfide oxidoreductase YuxK